MANPKMIALLSEVLLERNPDMLLLVRGVEVCSLADEQLAALEDTVLQEFMETGLASDGEPNARGLLLDDLMGYLAHCRISHRSGDARA